MVLHVLRTIAVTATACGFGYWLLTLWCARRFITQTQYRSPAPFTPPVSILKPLCGLDPEAYDNLSSHCRQDYPNFEIIFGVRDPQDPVVPAVQQLMQEFPHVTMRLVFCPQTMGMNFKVSNLIQMLPEARHAYIVINDSDIRVPSDYLRRVIEPLANRSVGMVTCLYRGIASDTLGSKLESLAIGADFIPGVLAARSLEKGVNFALGSTLAFPRRALNAVGGLEAVVDHLADDYELGHRISRSGFKVVIAPCVVDHHLPPYTMPAFFQHQLRWGRTVRDARPGGYAGLVFTFVIPWSLMALVASGGDVAEWMLLGAALLLRVIVSLGFGLPVLKDRRMVRNLWLIPIRDILAVAVWIACYMGKRVVWRGNTFELANGKLRPA
jgi:ceramide glucosyltransferase